VTPARDSNLPSAQDPATGFVASPRDLAELREEFDAASRRSLRDRFRYAFIRTHKPVMDDAGFRAFESMREYRDWCQSALPDWLGYGRI